MALYLHLVGAFARPEDARSDDAVGWIHTLGPLETVAEVQGDLRLVFADPNNPLREGLLKGDILLRVDNRYLFAGEEYASCVINATRRYPS